MAKAWAIETRKGTALQGFRNVYVITKDGAELERFNTMGDAEVALHLYRLEEWRKEQAR